ncbi:uncharacterized protein LOC129890043 isoform X3 [Solanum dulcamara]|uniref:uncharacterized protein LOC129890043 isoform X3 n=1 Tax=Solanum dulcamara TaxID=45834 RepID=UPI0024861EFD|nr:uncharacterized protein LOC129890043 isoform X3 [Solanum dulcamara]
MSKIMEIPPGFTKPLCKRICINDTYMQDDKSKTGSVNELSGKMCSLRERVPPNPFIPVHFRLRPRVPPGSPPKQRSDVTASQPSRRGPGRPQKQKSDEISASQPSRRRPGRPRKKISNAVSPPAPPSGLTEEVPVQISATAGAPELVAPPPGPSLGSSSHSPLEVPYNSEEEQSETKLNLNPLLRLKKPPRTNCTPEMLDEELKKVILKVEYLLVQKLLTSENDDVDCMVHQANTTFTYLKGFGVDYGSFYRDVTEYIEHRYNLHDAERQETSLSFSVWGGNYLNAMRNVNDVDEVIVRTHGEHEKVKEKMGSLKRQIEVLNQELAHFEHEDERLRRDMIKYKEAREVAEAKRKEINTQLEAAQAKLREIKQRKNAALVGIESTTRRLESTYR